jgi:hypothetical protein
LFEGRLSAADHIAITALIHRYCWLIDAGDFDSLGQLFAHAEVHYRGGAEVIRRDPAALAAVQRRFVRIYPETGTPRTRHACSNIMILAEADGCASAVSTITVFQVTPVLPLQAIVIASYRDCFAPVDGYWQFSQRHIDVEMIGDLSAHLLEAI